MDLFLVYLICFGVGLVFTVLSAVFAHVFGGGSDAHVSPGDAHAEGGFGSHDMPGFSALSPTTIASFVTAFGGLGMIFGKFEATRSAWVSAPLAALGGFGVATFVFVLFRAVFRATQSSSESRVAQLAGKTATVITPIPVDGVGEIAYVDGGSRYTAPARAEDGQSVASGATVSITRTSGSQFYVRAS